MNYTFLYMLKHNIELTLENFVSLNWMGDKARERWPMRAAPPAYVSVTSLNTHSPHSNPSNGWIPPVTDNVPIVMPRKGGTTGSTPVINTPTPLDWEGGTCARVDVWLPESMKNSTALAIPAASRMLRACKDLGAPSLSSLLLWQGRHNP
jgi:hypothetical protein